MDELLSGCPILERLTFVDETDYESGSIEIHTPHLKYLEIKLMMTTCYWLSASSLHNLVEARLDINPLNQHV